MRIVREYNHIPRECTEQFIPHHILAGPVFSEMGIQMGGISTFYEGSLIKRAENRPYHILIMTIAGEGAFTMENEETVLNRTGDIFFSHARGQGHIHYPHVKPWTFLWLRISADHSWLIPPFADWGIFRGNSPDDVSRLRDLLVSIFNEESYIHEEGKRAQQLYTELFMIYLQRCLHIRQNYRLGRYQVKLDLLWKTISASVEKTWDLKDMCGFMNISRAQLSRLCMAIYRKSPGEKVREIKMEYAQALLRHFDCQVAEVSERIGYENTSNFSAAFKKYFGYSPRKAAETEP